MAQRFRRGFKSSAQRKAVMANIARMNKNQLAQKGIILSSRKDTDKDGVINAKDCQPLNPEEQGIIHNMISGMGRVGGYVVGEAKSGWKHIPKSFERQKMKTVEKEELKEAKADLANLQKIKELKVDTAKVRAERKALLKEIQSGDISYVKHKGKVVAVSSYTEPGFLKMQRQQPSFIIRKTAFGTKVVEAK